MKQVRIIIFLAIVTGMVASFQSCDEKDPDPLTVVSVATDSGVALDAASPAADIPVNAAIVVTFDKEVDASTAVLDAAVVKANGIEIPSTITVNGAIVTLKPNVAMTNGVNYNVSIAPTLAATDGAPAIEAEYTFKTYGRANVRPPQASNQLSYFSFSGNMNDEVGVHTPVAADIRNFSYNVDRFGYEGLAGDFNGSTTLVEIPHGEKYMEHKSFALSLWIKANSTKEGHFILGLAAWKGFQLEISSDWAWIKLTTQYAEDGSLSDSEDTWFTGTGETLSNGGWQGWTYHKEVVPHGSVGATYFKDKWAHVVCTYDASTKLATMYLNGEKVKQNDFNLWPVGEPKRTVSGLKFAGNMDGGNKLALGFIQASENRVVPYDWADPGNIYSNHFKGQMDDLRIFKVSLTAAEVATLYGAEKP